MNLKIANRLVELRKQNGLSQEALADKLGVSRQAVSKWECGAAAPDTDNLIALAELYGVSLDELLDYTPNSKTKQGVFQDDNDSEAEDKTHDGFSFDEDGIHATDNGKKVHIGPSGIFVKDGKNDVNISWKGIKIKVDNDNKDADDASDNSCNYNYNYNYNSPKKDDKTLKDSVLDGLSLCIAAIAFVVIGLWTNVWHPTWLVFFATPILPALFRPKTLDGTLPILVSGAYLLIGFLWGLWHPYWVLFLLIPVYYILKDIIKKSIEASKNK